MSLNFASTFPSHQFDFGDTVYALSLDRSGTINGIRYDNGWQYSIEGDSEWCAENQLEPACPRCFGAWTGSGQCPHCGFSYPD